jgi:hypothetical protein
VIIKIKRNFLQEKAAETTKQKEERGGTLARETGRHATASASVNIKIERYSAKTQLLHIQMPTVNDVYEAREAPLVASTCCILGVA